MTWGEAHDSREDHQEDGTHWNESMASGKMHGRRIEGVSKLLGRRSRPSDGGTSLVSEGRPCHRARPGPVELVAQRKTTAPSCQALRDPTTAPAVDRQPWEWVGAVVLARSKSPRAPAVEYHPVSGQHGLSWSLPVDLLVVSLNR